MDDFLHSPLQSSNYALIPKAEFSLSEYFGIKVKQFRYRNRTNAPYVSGDSIASLVDYIAFGRSKCEPLDSKRLAKADSIFVPGELFSTFLNENKDLVNARTIVTGNSDQNFTQDLALPKSVKLWICQNSTINPSASRRTLPIGIENIRFGRSGIPRLFREDGNQRILNKVLVPPMSATNLVRFKTILEAKKHPEIYEIHNIPCSVKDYFSYIKKYKFVLCCEGNGFDTHRLWETLYLGGFPVLIKSAWSRTLDYLSLPILQINSLSDISAELLDNFYQTHKKFSPLEIDALWLPYWKKVVDSATFQDY